MALKGSSYMSMEYIIFIHKILHELAFLKGNVGRLNKRTKNIICELVSRVRKCILI